ncbi:phosphonate C-P lyase system protein PhnG [Pseudogemmobacter sp. W21_MBD1_M6]|uniref:phosphonate C-P lyase system protein PhnG n=1 Tax=Pseudogemmobacter sp. W21_MBD1_M6 TaxID=3240271 RepID=UPI003F99304B
MMNVAERKSWMGLLAKAPALALADRFAALGAAPDHAVLRAPEIGAVMVRGRAGARGAPFNLGEMTVTRCSVQLATGQIGHGYVQGRDKPKAVQAALIDALMQSDAAARVREQVLDPLELEMAVVKSARAAKAAATRVEFFTLVRGED